MKAKHMQGVDDADVAAMGYAQLHTGISPSSAMQVTLSARTREC